MTQLIEVKTAELSGAALDWAVAKAEGWRVEVTANGLISNVDKYGNHVAWVEPSSTWSQGGPLIEKYRVDLSAPPSDSSAAGWDARRDDGELSWINAPTALIAACRAIVAAKLGDVVQVPAELVEGKA